MKKFYKGFTLTEDVTHVAMSGNYRKIAFTLAEVLITLGIIGIVAAMTLPTLIQNYKEKATITKLKKVYSSLSQAFEMIQTDYGDPTNWGILPEIKDETGEITDSTGANNLGKLFAKHLNVLKDCGTEGNECWVKQVYLNSLNGSVAKNPGSNKAWYKLRLADGVSIGFGANSEDCSYHSGDTKVLAANCGTITVDVNGDNKPNVYGEDVFSFIVSKYGIIPYGSSEDTTYPFPTSCSKLAGRSYGCAAWVIYNENMDYLHCDDLSWNGKHKCK